MRRLPSRVARRTLTGMSEGIRRRSLLGALAGTILAPRAFAADAVRLGILPFGTVQWVAEVIRHDRLDARHGCALATVTLANNDAGRVALMAGGADIVVSDWLFAAEQRQAGTKLCFAPFSSATGGVMVAKDAPIRGLGDLRGKRLGVAGGPLDKSWIIVRAAAQATAGLDLASDASPVFGAPPLLDAKLRQGQLDADLTFWNFAAQTRGRRLPPGDRGRGLRARARHQGPARSRRLRLPRGLGAPAPDGGRWFPRRFGRSGSGAGGERRRLDHRAAADAGASRRAVRRAAAPLRRRHRRTRRSPSARRAPPNCSPCCGASPVAAPPAGLRRFPPGCSGPRRMGEARRARPGSPPARRCATGCSRSRDSWRSG